MEHFHLYCDKCNHYYRSEKYHHTDDYQELNNIVASTYITKICVSYLCRTCLYNLNQVFVKFKNMLNLDRKIITLQNNIEQHQIQNNVHRENFGHFIVGCDNVYKYSANRYTRFTPTKLWDEPVNIIGQNEEESKEEFVKNIKAGSIITLTIHQNRNANLYLTQVIKPLIENKSFILIEKSDIDTQKDVDYYIIGEQVKTKRAVKSCV